MPGCFWYICSVSVTHMLKFNTECQKHRTAERELTTDDRGDQEVTRLSVSCVCVRISQKLRPMFVKGNKVNKQCSYMLYDI